MSSTLIVAALTLLPINADFSDEWMLSSSISSLSYVENNSIYDFVKGKESNYKVGNSAFSVNEVNSTAQYKNMSISVFYRNEWFLDYSKNTMTLYGATTNGELIDSGKDYDLDLSINHLSANGIRLGYLHQFNPVNFYVAGSYLNAKTLITGDVQGHVALTESCGDSFECYSGELDLSYHYSEDELFDRDVNKPKSIYGYSFDVGADWLISDEWFASFFIQDLFSEILWDQAPITNATATTATTVIVDGKYKIDPVITGKEGNENYKQRLAIKYNTLVSYQVAAQHSTYVQVFHANGATLTHLGYHFQQERYLYGLKYYPLEEALGVEFKNKYLGFNITSKPFAHEETELLEFNFSLSIPFS